MVSESEQQARYKEKRLAMVDLQLVQRGIEDPLVLNAMRTVPRELFLPTRLRKYAYEDGPLPISENQSISQPYIVAYMIDKLLISGDSQVLEIGTGSGYAAAVLAQIVNRVITVERHESLVNRARQVLHKLGYDNIDVIHTDGTLGWPEGAPYDGIVVTAGGPRVPEALKDQLAVGGRLLIPVGDSETLQSLVRVTRMSDSEFQQEHLIGVRFVPLVGEAGWQDQDV